MSPQTSGRPALGRALLGLLFRSTQSGAARRLKATAIAIAERLGLTRRRGAKAVAAAAAALEEPFRKVHFRPMEAFERDLQHFGVLRATKEELAARRRMLHQLRMARLRELAARNPSLLWLGMPPKKARTLGALLDHELGRGMAEQGDALAREAQRVARGLSEELLKVWNAALPRRREIDALLEDTLRKLEAAIAADPGLNPTRYVRTRLFDPWRDRFMTRLAAHEDLVRRLSGEAGLEVVKGSGKQARPRLEMHWSIDGKPLVVGIDVDHAEVRLEEAVQHALGPPRNPAALMPIVRGESLQLTEPRQNRAVFEWVRRENREAELLGRQAGAQALREDQAQWVADIDEAIAKMMAAADDRI